MGQRRPSEPREHILIPALNPAWMRERAGRGGKARSSGAPVKVRTAASEMRTHALLVFAAACSALAAANSAPETKLLARTHAAQVHPTTLKPAHAQFVQNGLLVKKGLKAVRAPVKHPHSPLQLLKDAPAAVKKLPQTPEGSLLKESIDDKEVGDFSKDHNKNDHRKMAGKFDWLLKASAPLYSAAKVVANVAQHKIATVIRPQDLGTKVGGSALEGEEAAPAEEATPAEGGEVAVSADSEASGNATDTAADESQRAADAKRKAADDAAKFLTISKDNEVYYFVTWIVVLVVVLAILGLCLLYAKKCLGAEGQEVPANVKHVAGRR